MEPVKFALVGLGGYGRWIMELLLEAEDRQPPLVKLLAAADPNYHALPHVEKLPARGVKLLRSIDEVLNLPDVEAVWLPVPIDLHRPFVEQTMNAGKVAIVEKPVTGTVDDLMAMIAARDKVGGRAAVGFQDIYADSSVEIKKAVVGGEIGAVRSATVHACTSRAESYYRRSPWAGKQQHNGTWVLDSPANNAVAHFINLALFFLGKSMPAMAKLESVTAELYRAYDIENYDTCSLRVMTEGGVPMLVHFTHACDKSIPPHVILHGDRGVMKYVMNAPATISAGGASRTIALSHDVRSEMADKLVRWIRGDRDVIVSTLEAAGEQLAVINGASEAAAVRTVSFERKKHDHNDFRVIPDIDALFERCTAEQKMLSELGGVAWAVPGGTRDLRNYTRFAGPKT